MLFNIFCVVLFMSVVQIGAHPVDQTNGVEIVKKFTIPQVITPNYKITINGTNIKDTDKDVTILLTSADSKDVCNIVVNIHDKYIKVSPALDEDDNTLDARSYVLFGPQEFSIKVSATVSEQGINFFYVTFTGVNEAVQCKINDLSNISYIVVTGGVEDVQNMLFEFLNTETI